jgi:hypothetical protein
MYILVLVKRYNIYIYDMVIVVSICVDNILLEMIILTETCKGCKLKKNFINHTGRWLQTITMDNIIRNSQDSLQEDDEYRLNILH